MVNPSGAILLQAVARAVGQWRYVPAALCHYAGAAPARPGDCAQAERVEVVPVTLSYAFTFQMERGQILVRRGQAR